MAGVVSLAPRRVEADVRSGRAVLVARITVEVCRRPCGELVALTSYEAAPEVTAAAVCRYLQQAAADAGRPENRLDEEG